MIKTARRIFLATLVATVAGFSAVEAAPKQIDPSASFGVGVYGTRASAKFWVNNEMAFQVGGNVITSSAAGAATELNLGGTVQMGTGAVIKNAQPHWMGFINYNLNNGQANGVNILSLGGGWGVDVFLTPRFTAGFDIIFVQLNSVSAPGGAGGTSFQFFNPVITSHYYF